MSDVLEFYAQKFKRIGHWVGVRYLRNQGLPLFMVYQIAHNRPLPTKYSGIADLRCPRFAS